MVLSAEQWQKWSVKGRVRETLHWVDWKCDGPNHALLSFCSPHTKSPTPQPLYHHSIKMLLTMLLHSYEVTGIFGEKISASILVKKKSMMETMSLFTSIILTFVHSFSPDGSSFWMCLGREQNSFALVSQGLMYIVGCNSDTEKHYFSLLLWWHRQQKHISEPFWYTISHAISPVVTPSA